MKSPRKRTRVRHYKGLSSDEHVGVARGLKFMERCLPALYGEILSGYGPSSKAGRLIEGIPKSPNAFCVLRILLDEAFRKEGHSIGSPYEASRPHSEPEIIDLLKWRRERQR